MSVATFNIVNYGDIKIIIDGYKKISELRDIILERLNVRDKFCRIECILYKPIRKFGILTLDPGELSDIYDNELIMKFNIMDKTININVNFEEKRNNKIDLKKLRKTNGQSNTYNSKYNTSNDNVKKEFKYSDDDFPPLG
tara:strand:- start:64 stop:483 length:420 start_codon:yes stop_codon:yes gene_type:complete